MPVVTMETLPNGTKVYISKNHRFGSDSLLLSSFAPVRPGWRVCDLGSGCGILLLSLIDRGLAGPAVGIELQPEGQQLLAMAAQQNKLDTLESLCMDLREYRSSDLFDLVLSNPPYFNQGQAAQNPARAAARHQLTCTIDDVCLAAFRLLKQGGRFCLCYPAGNLSPLFTALCNHQLEPKRLQFVRKTAGHSPWLVLVEARRSGGHGLEILPDILLTASQPLQY